MTDRVIEEKNLVRRHSVLELVEHWAIALSGILLILTGFLQLPIGKRYYITEIPWVSWSGDFYTTLTIHYIAAVVFVAAAFFHVFYHGLLGEGGLLPRRGDLKESIEVIKTFFGKGDEPPFKKYLPEQRLAYAGMAFIIAMLIISGLVKTYKNLLDPQLSYAVTSAATWIHNIFFVLFIAAFIAHIAALVIKPNRPMVRGIFTGTVRLDYARGRHSLWMAGLERTKTPSTDDGRGGGREEVAGAGVREDGNVLPGEKPDPGNETGSERTNDKKEEL